MRWEQFQFDYRVQLESLHSDLVQIEAYKEAALNLVLPPPWREQLDRLNRIRAVHGTTALEGNPLTEAEVGRQMEMLDEGAPLPPEQSREQQQVRNAARAQQWIRETFVPGGRPIGAWALRRGKQRPRPVQNPLRSGWLSSARRSASGGAP